MSAFDRRAAGWWYLDMDHCGSGGGIFDRLMECRPLYVSKVKAAAHDGDCRQGGPTNVPDLVPDAGWEAAKGSPSLQSSAPSVSLCHVVVVHDH